MSEQLETLRSLSDDAVLTRVEECVARERRATAHLIASLSELDARRLYPGQGFGSMFDYCTRHLHLSERAAYVRIAAARLARRFPIVLDLIADSRVSLTAVSLLAKHLNEANHRALLEEAIHKTAGEIEVIVARLAPKPDAAAIVRRVSGTPQTIAVATAAPLMFESVRESSESAPESYKSVAASSAEPAPLIPQRRPDAVITPLAPERFKIQFTISGETRAKLRMTQDLLRHSLPTGDLAAIFERALSALLADLEKKKLALVARPRKKTLPAKKGSRLIPSAVRRAVWARDQGRCAFVGHGGRCRERSALELHHVKPFAAGGLATVANIELRCRAHNAHEADVYSAPQRGP